MAARAPWSAELAILVLVLVVNQRRRITRQKLQAHRELETQVALRTQALSEANEHLRREVAGHIKNPRDIVEHVRARLAQCPGVFQQLSRRRILACLDPVAAKFIHRLRG